MCDVDRRKSLSAPPFERRCCTPKTAGVIGPRTCRLSKGVSGMMKCYICEEYSTRQYVCDHCPGQQQMCPESFAELHSGCRNRDCSDYPEQEQTIGATDRAAEVAEEREVLAEPLRDQEREAALPREPTADTVPVRMLLMHEPTGIDSGGGEPTTRMGRSVRGIVAADERGGVARNRGGEVFVATVGEICCTCGRDPFPEDAEAQCRRCGHLMCSEGCVVWRHGRRTLCRCCVATGTKRKS